jgi:hypothetical protein
MEVEFIQKAIQNTLDHPGNTLCETSTDLLGTCLVQLKEKTETRVYLINNGMTTDEFDEIPFNEVTDEQWMDEAERQGSVYTLDVFASEFNSNNEINQDTDSIRFIEVPVSE